MTATESWTCIVCGETEDGAMLYELCGGCGETYHYNQTNRPGKDCGAAWIEDEEVGMVFFCNTCMDTARAEDQRKIESITQAVASGTVTPGMLVELMQALQNTGAAGDGPTGALGGFPGLAPGMPGAPLMPGMPGGGAMSFPGPISGAELSRMFGQPAPALSEAGEAAQADAPPPLGARRTKAERRYRRVR